MLPKGNWAFDLLDQLPAEIVIGVAALRFLSTAPLPKFIHDRRTVLLNHLQRIATAAFFACCPTIFMLLVWLLVLANYYVLVVMPAAGLSLPALASVVGYCLLAVQMVSFTRTLRTHPGSPPIEWRHAAVGGGVEYYICRWTGRRLPPRAYHVRAIGEDICFLDHFCSWLNRPIGLRNRKFFLLFLAWSTALCVFGLVRCVLLLYSLYHQPGASAWMVLPFLPLGPAMGGMPMPMPAAARADAGPATVLNATDNATGVNSTLAAGVAAFRFSFRMATGALVLDLVSLLFLGGFAVSALSMAACGRVALNPNDASFDVGTRLNLEQIFGRPVGWRWLLPLEPRRLATDGLQFPRNKQFDETGLLTGQPEIDI